MKALATLIFLLAATGFSYSQTEKKPTSMDTLKRDMRTLGNAFKKAGKIHITINGINYNDRNFLTLKQQILKAPNVLQTETKQLQQAVDVVVTYKGKSTDLWATLPQNAKQPFIINAQTDTSLLLDYSNAVSTRPTAAKATSTQVTGSPPAATASGNKSGNTSSAGLSPEAALLFKGVKTKLSDAEKNKFAKGFKLSKDRRQFVAEEDELSEYPYGIVLFPTDLNGDGKEEIFMVFGNTFTSGGTGSSVVAYIPDKAGNFQANLGFPGVTPDVLLTRNLGYPDLLIGGMGFEFPVWRWNGKQYNYYRKVKDAEYEKLKKTSMEEVSKAYGQTLPN